MSLCLLHQHTQYWTVSKAIYIRNQLWLTSELKDSVQNMHTMCVCVYIYVVCSCSWVGRYICSWHTCVWKPEKHVISSSINLHLGFWDIFFFSESWSSLSQQDRLINEFQGACLSPPSIPGVVTDTIVPSFFPWVLETWTQTSCVSWPHQMTFYSHTHTQKSWC